MAYFCTAALFVAMHLATPTLLGQDLERMAYVLLFTGTVFGLLAMATGFLTLWSNYRFKTPRLVKQKIALSAIMLGCAGAGLVLGAGGPPNSFLGSAFYHGLLVLLALITLVIGYLGGQMTFPTKVR